MIYICNKIAKLFGGFKSLSRDIHFVALQRGADFGNNTRHIAVNMNQAMALLGLGQVKLGEIQRSGRGSDREEFDQFLAGAGADFFLGLACISGNVGSQDHIGNAATFSKKS